MATDKSQLRITGLGEEISALANLPWEKPLEEWPEDPSLTAQRGISRHIVRLVRSSPEPDSEIYAVKETVEEFATREYEALRELGLRGAPSVSQIAIVNGRKAPSGEELPCAIVTRFLPYSFRSRLPAWRWTTNAYLRFSPVWRVLGKQFLLVATKPT